MVEAIAVADKRNRNISITVTESVRAELEKLADKEDRSLSWVAGALMNRGLDAFRKDRQLKPDKRGVRPVLDVKLKPKKGKDKDDEGKEDTG